MSTHTPTADQPRRRKSPARPVHKALAVEGISQDVKDVLVDLCSALAGLIEALPGQPSRATDVARVLGINGPLAWQVFRVATATNPLESVPYLPTSRQLLRVVTAAEDAGADHDALQVARAVCERYHVIAISHAKDHAEFESLLGSLASGVAEQIDIKHRRALFRGNTHVYGLQARTAYVGMILNTSQRQGVACESMMLLGRIGVHLMRPDVPFTINAVAGSLSQFDKPTESEDEPPPSEAAGNTYPVGPTRLVEDLGTARKIQLEQEPSSDGRARSRVVFPGVGRGASVSFMVAQDFRSVQAIGEGFTGVVQRLTLPAEKLVLDLLVPQGSLNAPKISAKTYACRDIMLSGNELREEDLVPIRSSLIHMPGVTDVPATPDVPGLPRVVRSLLTDKGWHGTKYDMYRCCIDYPIMHSRVALMAEQQTPDR